MATFMLIHRHANAECRVAFAAWRGYESPLRHGAALSTCVAIRGEANREAAESHSIWWTVEAADRKSALSQLPPFVAERTEVSQVQEVPIP